MGFGESGYGGKRGKKFRMRRSLCEAFGLIAVVGRELFQSMDKREGREEKFGYGYGYVWLETCFSSPPILHGLLEIMSSSPAVPRMVETANSSLLSWKNNSRRRVSCPPHEGPEWCVNHEENVGSMGFWICRYRGVSIWPLRCCRGVEDVNSAFAKPRR